MTAARLKALRFDKQTTKDVARLVELHLRFHGYGDGAWTDSAVRRYVTDAGPLLPRLHRLTRSDSTTRNARKAQRLRLAYDDLERRIEAVLAQESLKAVRPDLDGTAIMRLLDLPPGPLVGRAYTHMLAVRMDTGPLGPRGRRGRAAALVGRAAGVHGGLSPCRLRDRDLAAARDGWGGASAPGRGATGRGPP